MLERAATHYKTTTTTNIVARYRCGRAWAFLTPASAADVHSIRADKNSI
jgi:hypothetical protein